MESGSNLQNRGVSGAGESKEPKEPRGSAEAQAAIRSMKGDREKGSESGGELAVLRERIARARAVAPPSGDNAFAQGCFNRGRDAALAIIDGEASS
jgi:hypothetical protein